jgi:TRAP-type mannitol/chloroaromatic compound transport system permease small subunit
MFKPLSALLAGIESLINFIGRATLWVALAMISLVALNVLLRYAFSFG